MKVFKPTFANARLLGPRVQQHRSDWPVWWPWCGSHFTTLDWQKQQHWATSSCSWETSPQPNNKTPAILYTYSGLRNRRAAVYVGSFSGWAWVTKKAWVGWRRHWEVMAFSETTVALFCALMGLDFFFLGSGWIDLWKRTILRTYWCEESND